MSKREYLLIILVLAAAIWAARFAYSDRFGLYEDDYNRIPETLAMSGGQLVTSVADSFHRLSEHGKVLHAPTIQILTLLGGRLNSLQGVYWVAFAINLLNTWLFYMLLHRLGSSIFALVGGLAYSVFSADTTQALLTHALGIQPSLTYLLLAFHSYLSDRKLLAYVLAFLILLNYETPFPVFLAATLLAAFLPQPVDASRPRPHPNWKHWLQHILVMGGMVLLVVVLRRLLGESRISALDLQSVLRTPLVQMAQGAWTSLRQFLVVHPLQAVYHADIIRLALMGVMFLIFAATLWLVMSDKWNRHSLHPVPEQQEWTIHEAALRLLVGLVLLVLAYPITFTVAATAVDGRDTRVHLAAVVGASWLVAWGGTVLLNLAARNGRAAAAVLRGAIALGLAAFFATQVGFGLNIQRDYAFSWQYQRQFWTQILPLVNDAQDGDIIVVEPSVMRTTGHVGVITWNSSYILEQIYSFPTDWNNPPRVYRLEPGWEDHLAGPEGTYQINGFTSFIPEDMYVEVENQKLIFIESQDIGLVRHTAPLQLNGVEYPVKQPGAASGPFPPGVLYDLMILEP